MPQVKQEDTEDGVKVLGLRAVKVWVFSDEGLWFNVDPGFINPFPLLGIIIGILILRPLEGGGVLIMGLH